MTEVILTKICTICKIEKDINLFPKRKKALDGYRNQCKICKNKQLLLWKKNNPEKLKIIIDRRNKKFPEKIKLLANARSKKWRKNNLEKSRKISNESSSKYWKNNPEKRREKLNNWRSTNNIAHKAIAQKRRALNKNAEGFFNKNDIKNLFLTQNNKCVYCNLHLAITGYHIDHIMPLVLGGSNWINNIQLLCPQCNLKKHAKNPDIYEKEIGYIRIKL